jgi:hypothetical protein
MNPLMAEDLVKCREAELRTSRAPNVARPSGQEGPQGRSAASRRALLRGRALSGRLLLEAGLHLLAATE